ncbi:hypothetical protein N752_06795 [Desulforamulus aquiferis]|nr:alpha/beta fold hydrolase [Desulforamulus aquiferis]RYD05947.1 hypothetical protein N752_06795 [Desulforamulus aquiferis]
MEQKACLIIHGFTGSPQEVIPLARYLESQNFLVAVPTLAGHGHGWAGLKNCSYQDWLSSAEIELLKLFSITKHVSIIGFSMGGLIAVQLAKKHQIDSLVLLSTPIFVGNSQAIIENLLGGLRKRDYRRLKVYATNVLKTPLRQ